MKQHVNVHRLLSLMMLVSCFISLAVRFIIFFIVPSMSVLIEFHCLIKSNICQTVIQTSCESRTVSWKLTTVVYMARLVRNQSEHEKDNRGIVLEGH